MESESRDRVEDDFGRDGFLQDGLRLSIAQQAARCKSLFHKSLAMPGIPICLDDERARFTWWGSDNYVYSALNVSLDYKLRFSPVTADRIHRLLDRLCDLLTSLKPLDDPPQLPSWKRQRGQEDNMSKINEGIVPTMTELVHLGVRLRESVETEREHETQTYTGDADEEMNNAVARVRSSTEYYIRFRFPRAPDSLRAARVEANAVRLRRLYYQRDRGRHIDWGVESPQATPAAVPLPENNSSCPPSCPLCGFPIEFFNSTGDSMSWRDHFVDDLEPFTCVSSQCLEAAQHNGKGPRTFGTSEAWLSHMRNAHRQTWICTGGAHGIMAFDQEIQCREHFVKKHRMPAQEAARAISAVQRPALDSVLECPFGDGFQPPPDQDRSDAVFPSEVLESHVVAHLEEIALLTGTMNSALPAHEHG